MTNEELLAIIETVQRFQSELNDVEVKAAQRARHNASTSRFRPLPTAQAAG